MRALVALLGVGVALLGWGWVHERSEVNDLRTQVGRSQVELERLEGQVKQLEEEDDANQKIARRRLLACSELLNNYAGAEQHWMDIIQGLVFDSRSADWAEQEWNGVIQAYFAELGGGDLREEIGRACGVVRDDRDSQWALVEGSPSGG